jgi:anti-sigma regulatory factor (Ser/Thr protein kinase)
MIALSGHRNDLHLSYDKKDYSIIEDASDKFYVEFNFLDDTVKAHVGIVLDEIINNLISYEKREDLKIDLDFIYEKGTLTLVISSNGDEFNPFENHKEKHLKESDEDVAPGGFGISLIKSVTKKQSYSYKDHKSVITLII